MLNTKELRKGFGLAAGRLAQLTAYHNALNDCCELIDAQQALIDALMLEFCPKNMTREQVEEWARNQKSVEIEFKVPNISK